MAVQAVIVEPAAQVEVLRSALAMVTTAPVAAAVVAGDFIMVSLMVLVAVV